MADYVYDAKYSEDVRNAAYNAIPLSQKIGNVFDLMTYYRQDAAKLQIAQSFETTLEQLRRLADLARDMEEITHLHLRRQALLHHALHVPVECFASRPCVVLVHPLW